MTDSSSAANHAWSLVCSGCGERSDAVGLPTVCPACGDPWLVEYASAPPPEVKNRLLQREWSMWRYREWLPLMTEEQPVTLGEGMTPLLRVPTIAALLGMENLLVKDEGQNPCGSFKARGLSAAVTRAVAGGAHAFTVPTAGNAGIALAAYGQRAGLPVRVYAPRSTPATILQQIRLFAADLHLLDGHIGDCGKASRAYASDACGRCSRPRRRSRFACR